MIPNFKLVTVILMISTLNAKGSDKIINNDVKIENCMKRITEAFQKLGDCHQTTKDCRKMFVNNLFGQMKKKVSSSDCAKGSTYSGDNQYKGTTYSGICTHKISPIYSKYNLVKKYKYEVDM